MTPDEKDGATIETTTEAIKAQALAMLADGCERDEVFEWLSEVLGEIHTDVMGAVDYAIEILQDAGEVEDSDDDVYELPVGGAAID